MSPTTRILTKWLNEKHNVSASDGKHLINILPQAEWGYRLQKPEFLHHFKVKLTGEITLRHPRRESSRGIVCQSCALFNGEMTLTLRGCQRRLCNDTSCFNVPHAPSDFNNRHCVCAAHVNYRQHLYVQQQQQQQQQQEEEEMKDDGPHEQQPPPPPQTQFELYLNDLESLELAIVPGK